MADNEWTQERIAELRRLAECLGGAEAAVAAEERAMRAGGWSAPLDDAISDEERAKAGVVSFLQGGVLLSLLDELERVTRERDERSHLVYHMWIHDGSPENGFWQMTTQQKSLYSKITGR